MPYATISEFAAPWGLFRVINIKMAAIYLFQPEHSGPLAEAAANALTCQARHRPHGRALSVPKRLR